MADDMAPLPNLEVKRPAKAKCFAILRQVEPKEPLEPLEPLEPDSNLRLLRKLGASVTTELSL